MENLPHIEDGNKHKKEKKKKHYDGQDTGDYMQSKSAEPSSSVNLNKPSKQLPYLILNDGLRSRSYRRLARSTDFEKVKSSPLATRQIHAWKPLERLPSRVIQAKVKLYKPPKRLETTNRPSSPFRLTVDFETKDAHAQNHERTMAMKRLQYLREHTEWSIFPYGDVDEREHYK